MVVLCHLRAQASVAQLAVWGASMGAAASIFYQARGAAATPPWPQVDAAVLDSPYPDFTQLAHHLVSKRQFGGFTLPSGLVSVVLGMLESSVEKSAKFSIQWLTPITYVDRCWAPALFMLADHDPLITMQHIETLAKNYSGPRTLAMLSLIHI